MRYRVRLYYIIFSPILQENFNTLGYLITKSNLNPTEKTENYSAKQMRKFPALNIPLIGLYIITHKLDNSVIRAFKIAR